MTTDSTTPEVQDTVPVVKAPVQDMGFAINQIAEANNQIREKETTIGTLSAKEADLQKSVAALEANKRNLEEENNKKYNEGKDIGVRKEELMQVAQENIQKETEALEALRVEISTERETLEKEKAEVEAGRAEADRIRIDNEKVSAELESKILEAKRLSSGRDGTLEAIKTERAEVDTERKKTQILKDETTQIMEENKTILEKIEESRAGAEETFEAIRQERAENERIKAIAQAEVGSADFIKNEAHRLVMVFRQALHTFISVNGSTVRIPDLTPEDLKFVAKDIISQIPDFDFFAEFPEHFADKVVPESTAPTEANWEKMTKPQLAEQAKNLFNIDLDPILFTQKQMVEELNKAKIAFEKASSTVTE